jgi:hypothetical protein
MTKVGPLASAEHLRVHEHTGCRGRSIRSAIHCRIATRTEVQVAIRLVRLTSD